jgi:hypothetical protein
MSTLEHIAYELHRPARKIFCRRHVVTRFRNELLQADLIDLQTHFKKNNGFKYILVVIDTYTKFVWVEPLKNKTAKEVTKHMASVLKKVQPKLLQTDNGTEFYNKDFQDLMNKFNIKHYSTYSSVKAGMAERVIRTIKNKIYRNFTAKGSWNWIKSLTKLILDYNNTKHTTINCTPFEAQSDPNKIQLKLETRKLRNNKNLKINDKVRISKYKHVFAKGFTLNWTTEIFTISKILHTNPVTYQLKDELGNIIQGCFYEEEIKKTNFPNTFLIERIIKKNKNKMLVKWLGSPYNTWITAKDIII